MMLLRIAPGPSGFEFRTFECAKCDHVETVRIIADSLKSASVNRLSESLRPPR